jgi:hypothetical protein
MIAYIPCFAFFKLRTNEGYNVLNFVINNREILHHQEDRLDNRRLAKLLHIFVLYSIYSNLVGSFHIIRGKGKAWWDIIEANSVPLYMRHPQP